MKYNTHATDVATGPGPVNANSGQPEQSPADDNYTHITDFVAALSDDEFAYLKTEVDRRLNGEGEGMEEEITEEQLERDLFNESRPATKNSANDK